jgi:hypothetical protein
MRIGQRGLWIALAGAWLACGPGDDEQASTGATEAASATGEATSAGQSSASGQTASASASDTTAGIVVTDCEDARDAATCDLTSNDDQDCRWVEVDTFALASDGTCGLVEREAGYCVLAQRGDDSCGLFAPENCPDGETTVFYNAVGLEIGAVELFVEAPGAMLTCEGPGGPFMPCTYDGAVWDPPECACGCPG